MILLLSVREDPKILARKELSGGRTESRTGIKFARLGLLFRHAGDETLKKIILRSIVYMKQAENLICKMPLNRTHNHTQNINFKSFNAKSYQTCCCCYTKMRHFHGTMRTQKTRTRRNEEEDDKKPSQKEVQ